MLKIESVNIDMSSAFSKGHCVAPAVLGRRCRGHVTLRFHLLAIKKQVDFFPKIPIPENVLFSQRSGIFVVLLRSFCLEMRLYLWCPSVWVRMTSALTCCASLNKLLPHSASVSSFIQGRHQQCLLYVGDYQGSGELRYAQSSEQNLTCSTHSMSSRHYQTKR